MRFVCVCVCVKIGWFGCSFVVVVVWWVLFVLGGGELAGLHTHAHPVHTPAHIHRNTNRRRRRWRR